MGLIISFFKGIRFVFFFQESIGNFCVAENLGGPGFYGLASSIYNYITTRDPMTQSRITKETSVTKTTLSKYASLTYATTK